MSSSFFFKNKEKEKKRNEKMASGLSTVSWVMAKSHPRFARGKVWKQWMGERR